MPIPDCYVIQEDTYASGCLFLILIWGTLKQSIASNSINYWNKFDEYLINTNKKTTKDFWFSKPDEIKIILNNVSLKYIHSPLPVSIWRAITTTRISNFCLQQKNKTWLWLVCGNMCCYVLLVIIPFKFPCRRIVWLYTS